MTNAQNLTELNSNYLKRLEIHNLGLSRFADLLTDMSAVSNIIESAIKYLSEIYKENDICFYHDDSFEKHMIRYKLKNENLEVIAIRDNLLTSRIRNKNQPEIKKRSISLRKNIRTLYYPFRVSNSDMYLIEIPAKVDSSILDSLLDILHELKPILILSLTNAFFKNQLEFQAKETTKILNSNPSGVISINTRGIVVFVNQMFEMMTGYSMQELRSSSLLINQIFPEFSFIMLEGKELEDKMYYMRRKDGSNFPCFVSITQVTEGEETTLILTLNDASYSLRQNEEIVNLRKVIANEDNVGVALFRFAAFGGELIKEDLRSIELVADYFSTMCYTSIAQGNSQITGVFGPIPAPKIPNYRALVFAFFGKDDIQLDPRMKGIQYYLIAVVFPNTKTEFLIPNKTIDRKFRQLMNSYEYPNRMSKQDLSIFRDIVFVDEEGVL